MPAATTDSDDSHETDYLRALGDRIRSYRARRGMSRRLLAQSSGVSERYLADLESGKGNISILKLRDITRAISIPIEDLVHEPAEHPSEYTFLLHYIRQANPQELQRLYTTLSATTKIAPKFIALIGLRGAGKTTLGQALAQKLSLPFIELVETIANRAGMPVNEVFSLGGQATYRRLERQCLEEIIARPQPSVVAVGGSLVSEPTSYQRLLDSGVTIWLRAQPEEHMARVIAQGDERPMAGNARAMDDLKRILIERETLYRRANYIVDTSDQSVERSLLEITNLAEVNDIAAPSEVA